MVCPADGGSFPCAPCCLREHFRDISKGKRPEHQAAPKRDSFSFRIQFDRAGEWHLLEARARF